MITVTGRTFDHRDTIRAMGGYWNNADRCWQLDRASAGQIAQLRQLVGVMVIEKPSARPEPLADDDDKPMSVREMLLGILGKRDGPRPVHNGRSAVFGDDPTFHNHFADQNPRAFFGFSNLAAMTGYLSEMAPDARRDGWAMGNEEWAGTRTMADALKLARDGWQEGTEKAAEIAERLSLANPRVRRRQAALAGGSVNVGRMLAGDPAHMIRRPKQPGRKVVTFFVEAGCAGYISAESMTIRAALIGAMIDQMENAGYSCSIIAVDTSLNGDRPVYQLAVNLKEAGERLNLADVMFALGHPSFLRRLSFGVSSSVEECRSIYGHQGSASDAFDDHHPCGRGEFYVPVLRQNISDGDPLDALPMIKPGNLPIEIEKG